MKLEITDALRAYFENTEFRNAIDGLVPRIDGEKAIQIDTFSQYHEFNDALLTATQVRHDIIAFLVSACEVSYLEAVKARKWRIEWDKQPPSDAWDDSIFFITVDSESSEAHEFDFNVEIDLSRGAKIILSSNLYNRNTKKYQSVDIDDHLAQTANLKVKRDEEKIKFLSSKKFTLSEFLDQPDALAENLAEVGTAIVSLMMD